MDIQQRVAIVGMGGLFSQSPTLEQFWSHILHARDTSREVPPGRWLLAPEDAYDPAVGAPDKVYSLRGYFIDSVAFDLSGFRLSPDLLAQLDPVFHLVLHAGRQA